jgi:hypothetical protein
MITASAIARLLACPGSSSLPQARTTSEYADAGTARHAAIATAIDMRLAGEPHEPPAEFADLIEAIIGFVPTFGRPEVKLGYNPATGEGRELGIGADRDYGALSGEMVGTADVLAVEEHHVVVLDWKSRAAVASAQTNPQLAFLALAACAAYGKSAARVEIIYLRDGHPWRDVAELDHLDLEAFRWQLVDLRTRVEEQQAVAATGRMPNVSQGSHCQYCPATHACPASAALVRRLAAGDEQRDLDLLMPLDDETAAYAYERLHLAEGLLRRIRSALYARAAQAPFRLRNGKMLGTATHLGNESIDGDVAYEVLLAQRGHAAADAAVTRHATKKAIKAALKAALAPGETLAKAESSTLAEIRKRNGATRPTKTDVIEYDPERTLGEGGV